MGSWRYGGQAKTPRGAGLMALVDDLNLLGFTTPREAQTG